MRLLIIAAMLLRSDSFDQREHDVCFDTNYTSQQSISCINGFIEGARWQMQHDHDLYNKDSK